MATSNRSHRVDKIARVYDQDILPIWGERFGRMLLRELTLPDKAQVLNVECGTGYVALPLLRRLGAGSRVIAIDAGSSLLDVARRKAETIVDELEAAAFFRTESAVPRLSFADDVYDLVLCSVALASYPHRAEVLADFCRVTKPGGEVRCSVPIAGSFCEFYDIYREVLVKHDKTAAIARLDRHLNNYCTPESLNQWALAAGISEPCVEIDEFSMLFKSSREFFFAPVIELGPLDVWKAIAGHGDEMQDVFWFMKEAIDSYYSDRAFAVTVKAACLRGRVTAAGNDGHIPQGERVVESMEVEMTVDDDDITAEEMVDDDPR